MSKMTDEQFKKFRIKLLEDVFAINRDRKVDVELNSEKEFECGICPIKDTCTATTEEITPEYKKDWCLLERNKYFSRTGNTIEPVDKSQRTRK